MFQVEQKNTMYLLPLKSESNAVKRNICKLFSFFFFYFHYKQLFLMHFNGRSYTNVVPGPSYLEFLEWVMLSHGKIRTIRTKFSNFYFFFTDQSPLVGNSLHISKHIETEESMWNFH